MSSLKISNLILAVALVGLVGCATNGPGRGGDGTTYQPPRDENEPKALKLEDVVFQFDSSGNLVPISVSGKSFVSCGKRAKGDRACRLFKLKGQVLDVEDISITVIKHHHSPDCLYVQARRKAVVVESEACL